MTAVSKLKFEFYARLGYLLTELAFKTDFRGPFKCAYRVGCWCYGKAYGYPGFKIYDR